MISRVIISRFANLEAWENAPDFDLTVRVYAGWRTFFRSQQRLKLL
jgi:hypothetical protein